MTNQQAVIAEIEPLTGFTSNAVSKALVDAGLSEGADYNAANAKSIAVAAIKVLCTMLGVKSESEGGYQKTYSINERIAAIKEQYGLQEKSYITARNVW